MGVILFAMSVKGMPFTFRGYVAGLVPENIMPEKDPFFNAFVMNKTAYWKKFARAGISEELKSLLNAMLNYDPALRPSAADILTHPWMMGQMASQEQTAQELMTR